MTAPLATSTSRPRPPITPQLLIGILIIAVGVLFTLDNLGLAHADAYIRYWPLGLVAVGLLKIWQAREGCGGAFGGFVFTLAGLWLLVEQTVDVRISFDDMWPLLLVFAGVYLVWRGMTGRQRSAALDTHDAIRATAILSGVTLASSSRTFRGGDITAVMGGCEIDLRQAAINGDAVIEVFAMWGGVEIRVPDDWVVVNQATPILGAVEDKTRRTPGAGAHRLTIRGIVIMGGVEVKN
jgi:predicted membrane protein